jgi:propanediol dehydratase large subunit
MSMQPVTEPPAADAHESVAIGRLDSMLRQPVNLDGFSVEDVEIGLVALHSPYDPEPSIRIEDGLVTEMDGKLCAEFDLIDTFIAAHGLDVDVAEAAMSYPDVELARMICDFNVPRTEVVRICRGLTPAKMARVVALLRPAEIQIAMSKMRLRNTPSIQAHVTNRMDDPLLIAADAATAVAFGFRELETTVPVLADAPVVAVALLIGSQVGRGGALVQCSLEEAIELELGMKGLTTYAETVSIYGTDQVFVDGDDSPWSKAFLGAAYASRGIKMRVTSGGGSEVLMGEAQRCSILYLESRCVALARAMGSQGVQNGGIDSVAVTASVPNGMRGLLAENLMVMLRGLEACSGNDTLVSESDIRRTAHTIPVFFAGSDFIFSGFGSITRYDNTFVASGFNAEDIDDYLVLQRDWGVDGGLRTQDAVDLEAVRRRAANAVRAVLSDLGIADYDSAHVDAVVSAVDSRDLPSVEPGLPAAASAAIQARGVDVLDLVASLDRTGYRTEAERLMVLVRERVKGDYLQPAAIFAEDGRLLSAITDPNNYSGPGTGYVPTEQRRNEIESIRQQRSKTDLLADQLQDAGHIELKTIGTAEMGSDPREVVIGLSPSFAVNLWRTLAGLQIGEVLRQILAGLEEEGCVGRLVRVPGTIDVGLIGLTAARLAGSGIGIGLQAKGTAVIHRRDLAPLANLELFSEAPRVSSQMYRALGKNAARHAKGLAPVAIRVPGTEMAIEARYHARTVALVSVEREASISGATPLDVELVP